MMNFGPGLLVITVVFAASAMTVLAAPARVKSESHEPKASFRADLIEPGHTDAAQLISLFGKPFRRVQDTGHREYFFYDLGSGTTMDATVSLRAGVVEYISYLCNDSLNDVKEKFASEQATTRMVQTEMNGFVGTAGQLMYSSKGRGYVYEPKTLRIRACVAWEPGKRFEDLGR